MWHGYCKFLPSNKLNIYTKEVMFLSCGTRQFSKFLFNLFRNHWVNTIVYMQDFFVIYEPPDGVLIFI